MSVQRWTMLGLAAVISGGCAASKSAQGPVLGPDGKPLEVVEMQREARPGERVLPMDVNADGNPDVWSYVVSGKDDQGRDVDRLARKELDLNADGRVDVARDYDERERLVREAMDLDFDGNVDQVNHYDNKGQISRKERDLDSNRRPDLWIYFERGQIVRKERDTNGDGRAEYWEYWENDHIDRIGEDLDGDGQVDKWSKAPVSEEEG